MARYELLLLVIMFALGGETLGQRIPKPTPTPVLQGVLLKSNQKPLQYTEIELVPVESNKIVNDARLFGISDGVGRFTFANVPDGKYTLSVNFGDKPTFLSPFTTFFHPGTSDRSAATVFTIDPTTRLKGVSFRMSTELVKSPIFGKIVWPDGRPVQGAVISCRDLEFAVRNDFGGTTTDKNGMFKLEAFVGRRYQLGVMLFDSDRVSPFEMDNIIALAESDEFVLKERQTVLVIQVMKPKSIQPFFDKYLS
jgi:hypothetical protein